jgi:hypothetical protein
MKHYCKNYKCSHQNWGECYAHITEHCDRFIPPDEKPARTASSPTYGSAPDPLCAVVDNAGNHCPEIPVAEVTVKKSGKKVWLCELCLESARHRWEIIEQND